MKLMYKDRVRVVTLACVFAAALVSGVGRRFGWPGYLQWLGAITTGGVVLVVLIPWGRSAPDAKDHIT
jgi:hypothetical protein